MLQQNQERPALSFQNRCVGISAGTRVPGQGRGGNRGSRRGPRRGEEGVGAPASKMQAGQLEVPPGGLRTAASAAEMNAGPRCLSRCAVLSRHTGIATRPGSKSHSCVQLQPVVTEIQGTFFLLHCPQTATVQRKPEGARRWGPTPLWL